MPDFPPLSTTQLQIVDPEGHPRIRLSVDSGTPVFQMLAEDGHPTLEVKVDGDGRPSVKLLNPDSAGPNASLEVDAKGAHIKFDHPGGASGYLFLNNAGASGLVLLDAKGERRLAATVGPDGTPKIETF